LVPSGETAMVTDLMDMAFAQVIFENLTRTVSPPIETRTIWRKVLLLNVLEGVFVVA
jgi:hypothetical protein